MHTSKILPQTWLKLALVIVNLAVLSGCSLVTLNSTETPTAINPTSTASAPTIIAPATATPSSTVAVLSNVPTNGLTPTATARSRYGDMLPTTPPQPRQGDTLPTSTPAPTNTPVSGIACSINFSSLNLHEGPGYDYRTFITLSTKGTVYASKRVTDCSWLLVATTRQEIGWIDAKTVACQSDVIDLPVAGGIAPPVPTQTPTVLPTPVTATPTTPALTPTPSVPIGRWRGEYYDNASLLGEPVLIREDENLDFNWILDSPAPGIPNDNFSVRWTGIFDFIESGDYHFFATVDDGIKVYIDGRQVIDAWHNTALPVPYEGDFADLQAGLHTIVVEYFESGGHAHIKVWAEKTLFVDAEWRGEYYNNRTLQEPATFSESTETIDFDWGGSAPDSRLNSNNFSVRWHRTFFFDPGDYKFYAAIEEDDNVRLTLDGWEIFNKYRDSEGTVEGYFAELGAGYHTLELEYQDHGDKAKIKFWWKRWQ